MPITHHVDRSSGIVYLDVAGSPTITEMCAAIDRVVADPDFEVRYFILSGHRGLDRPATTEQVHALLAHISQRKCHLGSIRWAIVVKKAAAFGMMRMLSVLAERIPARVEVFETSTRPKAG